MAGPPSSESLALADNTVTHHFESRSSLHLGGDDYQEPSTTESMSQEAEVEDGVLFDDQRPVSAVPAHGTKQGFDHFRTLRILWLDVLPPKTIRLPIRPHQPPTTSHHHDHVHCPLARGGQPGTTRIRCQHVKEARIFIDRRHEVSKSVGDSLPITFLTPA